MDKNTTILYLVRHTESIANEKRIYNSKIEEDEGLSDLGKIQAKKVVKFFKDKSRSIKKIYSSPFKRTIQTSQAIAEQLGINKNDIVKLDALRETNCGKWEGKTESKIIQEFPTQWKAWRLDPLNNPIPGGETLLDVQARVMPAINNIIRENRGKEVVIVTHYYIINTILCSFISSLEKFRAFDTTNGTIAKIIITVGAVGNTPRLEMYAPPII